ncbi:hypothetical protein [Qipengyuania gaetbuli]|uniref:hypothetical protein n=1 Tax=Qipengyuania gaetbuli TaxID=266952 RepID=UPI001CD25A07|nr:hypothetical protein [Qipengyuania gaetbuli]MCA0909845.1 hypothetical protein [Qipengyuania gaetbuli]
MNKLALIAALGLATPLAAQDAPAPPQLDAAQQASVRCGAAFAIVARGQADGDEAMARYPDLKERGLEFFVRSTARLMDETGADREAMRSLVMAEGAALGSDPASLHAVMPACLLMLDASGL